MRDALGWVGLLQIVTMGMAYGRTTVWATTSLTDRSVAFAPFLVAVGVWAIYMAVPLATVTRLRGYDETMTSDSSHAKFSDVGPDAAKPEHRRPALPRYVCPGTPQGDNARTVEETVREAVAVGLCGKTWALSRQDANVGEKYAQNAAPTAEIATDGVQAQERV